VGRVMGGPWAEVGVVKIVSGPGYE
jgi:hypothetical protein